MTPWRDRSNTEAGKEPHIAKVARELDEAVSRAVAGTCRPVQEMANTPRVVKGPGT